MIPDFRADETVVLEGTVEGREPLINEVAFEHECWRLWEESEAAVGFDPTGISDLVWQVVSDPWSSVNHIPRYGKMPSPARPTPELMPKRLPAGSPVNGRIQP